MKPRSLHSFLVDRGYVNHDIDPKTISSSGGPPKKVLEIIIPMHLSNRQFQFHASASFPSVSP